MFYSLNAYESFCRQIVSSVETSLPSVKTTAHFNLLEIDYWEKKNQFGTLIACSKQNVAMNYSNSMILKKSHHFNMLYAKEVEYISCIPCGAKERLDLFNTKENLR